MLAELGWTTVSASEETFGPAGTLLRETKGEVVLVSRLRAAQSALPNPHPRPFSHWEKGGRQAGMRVRSLLPPEAITATVSWISPFSPGGELGRFSASPSQMTGHGSGHGRRKYSDGIALSGSFVTVKTESRPDIYADI